LQGCSPTTHLLWPASKESEEENNRKQNKTLNGIVDFGAWRLSDTSNFSLSFKAKELKFCVQTTPINAKKFVEGIFKILSWG